MDIKEFKYAWRYTSENYALFSPKQLSEMNVVNENKAVEICPQCRNKDNPKRSYFFDNYRCPFLEIEKWGVWCVFSGYR